MGKRGGGRGNEGGLYPASITSDVLWTTTFHYPVAWSLSQVSACTLATLRAGDDSTLSPQSYKSNAYTLTLCIQGNRIPLKVVNKLTFAGP